eukprot:Gregarina_sp_Pseudo_9__3999@NODE_4141_length_479_cov_1_847727_g3812_i0_p1_GENE_NODE_4141_length_479_cov_1_847727_g3812_i0NODE_4141_length_479_cov_1_847727_g3812_i0_p1_ORF_typecomplete_len123_score28_53AAA_16/PF13191_6/9_9e11AAA_PrkA/PF08298_11/1_2e06AAA_22/PF13401_6/2_3e06AAA/PF00004_29/2_6e03AAA/PF00004_29/1_8e05Rad17/PF03215_15/9_9e06DUF815/PF05673_13/1_1e05ATPase_2/PF01637_18/2_3e05RuvB_N/PF05496_12/2_6e05AAA_30/PF13604_6/0_00032TsaE/PF02367_17/3_5e03TsaE/PF02367_17/0_00068TniB/PF05621_11/0_0
MSQRVRRGVKKSAAKPGSKAAPSPDFSLIPAVQSALRIEHLPQLLIGRDEQIKRLKHDLTASMRGRGGEGHVLYLYGQPGTGKTASVRHVVRELESDFDFEFQLINALGLTSVGNLSNTYTK